MTQCKDCGLEMGFNPDLGQQPPLKFFKHEGVDYCADCLLAKTNPLPNYHLNFFEVLK